MNGNEWFWLLWWAEFFAFVLVAPGQGRDLPALPTRDARREARQRGDQVLAVLVVPGRGGVGERHVSDIPACSEHGCICQWAHELATERLMPACSCIVGEVIRRAGVNADAVNAAIAISADPIISQVSAQIARLVAGKPS